MKALENVNFGTFVKHPDNNQAVLVAGGELLVRFVPADHLYLSIVPLQRLVHGQVGGCGQPLHLAILSSLELFARDKIGISLFGLRCFL